jgi:hypothetical protein
MEAKQCFNFDIMISGKVEEQLKVIQKLLDVHFGVYMCEIERQGQLHVCCHSNKKLVGGTVLNELRKGLSELDVVVKTLVGHNAYRNGCAAMNSKKCWKKGSGRVVEKSHVLWSEMQKFGKGEVNWVQYVPKIDPDNKFMMYAERNDLFVNIPFVNIPQLIADVYNVGAHVVYVIDLRSAKKEPTEKLYDALLEIRRGVVHGTHKGKLFHRSQPPAQIWCFADDIDCDRDKYDVFYLTADFRLVQRKRQRDSMDDYDSKQPKRIKLN